jgi:putative hydrolase of the HAD superfamily
MSNKIKVVVFDLGNVLIPFDYKRLENKLDKIEKGLGERFCKKYFGNYSVHRKFEKGELSVDDFMQIMLEWTEHKVKPEYFKSAYADLFVENKETTALLPLLKKSNKLLLLSNTNYIHRKYGWDKYDFIEYFDKLILSYEVGAAKPEKQIYRAAEEFTKLPPQAHLFIDDVKEYTDAAITLGWEGINFKTHKQLITELRKLGVIH